jgi:hypothetical protein
MGSEHIVEVKVEKPTKKRKEREKERKGKERNFHSTLGGIKLWNDLLVTPG